MARSREQMSKDYQNEEGSGGLSKRNFMYVSFVFQAKQAVY